MAKWELSIRLNGGPMPIHQQISRGIADDIRKGRLQARDPLPSSRALAQQLRVSRNTVVAAYADLDAQGWIYSERARGMFVSPSLRGYDGTNISAPETAYPASAGYELPPSNLPETPPVRANGLLVMLGGVPELRLVPHQAFAQAYRRALHGIRGRVALDYGDPRGDLGLRTAIAHMLSRVRGVPAPADTITIVRGSQQGIYLTAQAVLRPGDVVAVEQLGYSPAWVALRCAGADLRAVPVDRDGLNVDALEVLLENERVRAVYLTPHHHYPTTVTMSNARRKRLLDLAARHRMMILEDDYDHEFHYDAAPILPLASMDKQGAVVYVGTLSKVLAPGLRLGYVVAPRPVTERIVSVRRIVDGQGDHVLERALATLLEDEAIQRHVRRAHGVYHARRDVLAELLREKLPKLSFQVPGGGMAIWAHAPGVDVAAWARRALEVGVAIQTAKTSTFERRERPYVRLGFAACNEKELTEAVDRLARVLP
jgi:GntR family transcriptional regulator/MocR family aminotransferase